MDQPSRLPTRSCCLLAFVFRVTWGALPAVPGWPRPDPSTLKLCCAWQPAESQDLQDMIQAGQHSSNVMCHIVPPVCRPHWEACRDLAGAVVEQPQALCLQPPCGLGAPPPNSSDPFYALTGGRVLLPQKPQPAAAPALLCVTLLLCTISCGQVCCARWSDHSTRRSVPAQQTAEVLLWVGQHSSAGLRFPSPSGCLPDSCCCL